MSPNLPCNVVIRSSKQIKFLYSVKEGIEMEVGLSWWIYNVSLFWLRFVRSYCPLGGNDERSLLCILIFIYSISSFRIHLSILNISPSFRWIGLTIHCVAGSGTCLIIRCDWVTYVTFMTLSSFLPEAARRPSVAKENDPILPTVDARRTTTESFVYSLTFCCQWYGPSKSAHSESFASKP